MSASLVAAASLATWLYLLFGRGAFWRGTEREETLVPRSGAARVGSAWPRLAVVVPARNEAEVIADSITSLLRQTYPHPVPVVLVDDQSTDGTAQVAETAAQRCGGADRLTVIRGTEPPPGWTGKLWALSQGVAHLEGAAASPDFILLTDADIVYGEPGTVERLVRGALARGTVLTSLMVKLRCESAAERWLVPAFIFFFEKLYPFPWVNDPRRPTAAAAGGCMLVERRALRAAGGLDAVRQALIDDCALGALLKRQGPIWLGLTERVHSRRPYPSLGDIRRMVTRSAYAELRYSPLRLIGAVAGMAITYAAPPLLALFAEGAARVMGATAWAAMAFAYLPTLRLYGRPRASSLALPLVACLYTLFTIESALQHWLGHGHRWKGRSYAGSAPTRGIVGP